MGPLTALFPRSKPVPLGDRTFRVWELRIAELADLQECLDDALGCPFERALAAVEGMEDDAARREVLAEAYEQIESGLPSLWDERGTEWLSSLTGLCVFVLTCLKRGLPSITADDVLTLLPAITPAQYARLRRVAFGTRPLRVIDRMLGLSDDKPGPRLTWAEIIAETCERYGWAPAVIEGLTLSQLAAYRSGGKTEESGQSVDDADEATLARLAAEQYRRFYGREMPTEPDEGAPA